MLMVDHNLGTPSGARQQLGIAKPKAKAKALELSDLGRFFAREYATGRMRATKVGDGAASASSSAGQAAPDIARFAKAAAPKRGDVKTSKHSARSLQRSLAQVANRTDLRAYTCQLPMWDSGRKCKVLKDASVLPIHEILNAVIPEGAEDEFCSLSSDREGFADSLSTWCKRVKTEIRGLPICCLALWGDSAPMAHRNSLYLLTFKLLSGKERRRYWIFGCTKRDICQCGCKGRCTFQALWQIVAWSFKALAVGKWPLTDHAGNESPEGSWRAKLAGRPLRFRATCLAKCGD